MTVFHDNPAGRLHNVLVGFKLNASQQQVHSAWAGVLGVGADDAELLSRMAVIVCLPKHIESEIDKIDPDQFDRDWVMRWRDVIVPFLGPQLFGTAAAGQAATQITDVALASLEACSFTLHKYARQLVISDAELNRIRSLIGDLLTAVEEELPHGDELRSFLQHHAESMIKALDHYEIAGASELESALNETIGAYTRKRSDFAAKGYARRDSWKKFIAVTPAAVLVLFQIPQTALQLPAEIRTAIEGSSAPAGPTVIIHEEIVEPSQLHPSPGTDNSAQPVDDVERKAT